MSNYTDPNQVYETASDDTFWNSKVIRVGERFNVQVFDADGDRRPDREDSFADQALAIAFADKSVQRYSGREVGISRFDSSKPFMVGMLEFAEIADAVDAAAAASRLKENAFSAQMCQALQKGVYGYQGSSVAIAYFKHGRDLDELAADEDGVPDFDRRSKAFRPRNLLKRMESNERYVVVRLCVANQIQYLGRVSSLKEFEEYRECCGFEKSDIAVQDWKPAG